jgi:acyl dehydratase
VTNLTLSNISDFIGQELGVSGWMTVDQSRINAFADCTEDHQWIHVDVDRAKRESPFRAPIAHGYLMLSLIAPLSMEIGVLPQDVAAGFNYGLDKVRFPAPVRAGARVRLRVVLVGIEPKDAGQLVIKMRNTLEIEGSDKPAIVAETLAMLVPRKATGPGNRNE